MYGEMWHVKTRIIFCFCHICAPESRELITPVLLSRKALLQQGLKHDTVLARLVERRVATGALGRGEKQHAAAAAAAAARVGQGQVAGFVLQELRLHALDFLLQHGHGAALVLVDDCVVFDVLGALRGGTGGERM